LIVTRRPLAIFSISVNFFRPYPGHLLRFPCRLSYSLTHASARTALACPLTISTTVFTSPAQPYLSTTWFVATLVASIRLTMRLFTSAGWHTHAFGFPEFLPIISCQINYTPALFAERLVISVSPPQKPTFYCHISGLARKFWRKMRWRIRKAGFEGAIVWRNCMGGFCDVHQFWAISLGRLRQMLSEGALHYWRPPT
jgi:hypothetical protein